MNSSDFKESLTFLKLSSQESANLLGVNLRTVQRWISGDVDIPVAIEHVIKAWSYLNRLGLPWRPDGHSVALLDTEEMRKKLILQMQHSNQLAGVLEKVNRRGGPAAPWSVDLASKKATLGDIWVSFYLLPNGSFSPQTYGRRDKLPDTIRDAVILEDAYACIADAIAKRDEEYREADWLSVGT